MPYENDKNHLLLFSLILSFFHNIQYLLSFLVIDEKDIYYLLPIIEALIRGYCFYYLIKPFMISTVTLKNKGMAMDIASLVMGKKRNLFYIGIVYFFIMLLLYLLHTWMTFHIIGIFSKSI